MQPLDLLLLAVGLAMDAFAVAVSCGFAFQRREHLGALRIALSFGLFQAAMQVLGWAAGLSVRRQIEAWDHWIAFALLFVIGAKMIRESIVSWRQETAMELPDAVALVGLSLGFELEHRLRGRWRRNIQVAGGVILIAIGVRILLEHTLGP